MEAAVISAGHLVSSTQLIPPRLQNFVSGSVCPGECTRKVSTGSTLFSTSHASRIVLVLNPPPRNRSQPERWALTLLRLFRLQYLPTEGVQIHSVMLHGHLAARAIRLRHIRDGQELPMLSSGTLGLKECAYWLTYQEPAFVPIPYLSRSPRAHLLSD